MLRALLVCLLLSVGAAGVHAQGPQGPQGSLADARGAFARGDYADAEALLTALAGASHGTAGAGKQRAEAGLWLARLHLLTGRYAEAAAGAARLGGHARLGLAAQTLRAEAQWAEGQLDAAERGLRAVAGAAGDGPAVHRGRVLLGKLLIERGKRAAARPYLMALIGAYNGDALGAERAEVLCYVGMAAHALRSHQDANDAFNEAAMADPGRIETQLQWAALFAEKFDRDNALMGVSAAIAKNGQHPGARLLLAQLMFEHGSDFAGIDAELTRALSVNPKLVGAHVLRAAMALRNMALAEADAHLDAALAINPRDLPALSTRAAVRFLADDSAGFAQAKRAVTALNPHYSDMYRIIARFAEWEHRYEELVQMAREAIAMDARDPHAHATLAMNLLRMGDEAAGLRALQSAWSLDRFNTRVFNMLGLYDDVIASQYVEFDAPPFTVRIHRDEQAMMAPYLTPMLQRAMRVMGAHYGFAPEGPLRLEMFSESKHFAIRTSGLPNIGVQGVCFGKVVTAISPRAGAFNWGQIVWHELAHIFHLQLSKNHVPRWFTEGLAEYETTLERPEWRRERDYELWQAMRAGQLPSLAELNGAFTGARDPGALMAAYYAASLAAGYVVERFGFPKVRQMLAAWGRGVATPEVFSGVLGIDLATLDRDFRAMLQTRLARYDDEFVVDTGGHRDLATLEQRAAARPDDPQAQAAWALGLLVSDRRKEALGAARAALAIDPKHPTAHFVMAMYATGEGKKVWAHRCLSGILEGGHDGHDLRLMLADNALQRNDVDAALSHLEVAIARDPDGIKAYRSLLKVAEARQAPPLALRALRGVVRLDQHDRLSHLALLAVLVRAQDWQGAVALGQSALYVHPASPELHYLLGRAHMGLGQPALALPELRRAVALGHRRPGRVHLQQAEALLLLGRRGKARAAARAAVAADPKLGDKAEAILRAAGKKR